MSNDCNLSAIPEFDSTASVLSDLSYSRSDDDLEAVMHKSRRSTYKRHWPSGGVDMGCDKRRRSSRLVQLHSKDGSERMVAKTTVTMEHDGIISAQSHIETIPSAVDPLPSAPLRCGSSESLESGLSIENGTGNGNGTGFNQATPRDVGVLPISSVRVSMRNHCFVAKTVIRPEECDVCEKRIKFGYTVLRCQNCRASCHAACKENLPLPCIEQGSTPISKKHMGVIGDYAPSTTPMVPAVVQHCIKEIESRGLNEHGIYRVPGSEREVRALKERFMKCKGVPRLVDVDVHVICGFLKDFLRNLKEPLVTHGLWWEFAQAAEIKDAEERQAKLYQAISQLPQPNRDTLAFLTLHLLRVAEAKEMNKMPINNLATVLGVTVVGYPSEYNVSETYVLTIKTKSVMEQFLTIPAEYWCRVMSAPDSGGVFSTPHIGDLARSHRTPSTRSFKRLFDTPH